MRELFVSLGHNSSAVLAQDGRIVRGYEQERLDRVKSSSAFPKDAIDACLSDSLCDRVYVSHWFDHFDLKDNKYVDYAFLRCTSKQEVITLSPEFTHHDAHANSAVSFLERRRPPSASYVVVVDGFGTFQECLSVYESSIEGALSLIHRSYGFRVSLGLMYQYVTEYLGLKPHQDEYKLLGYESRARGYVPFDQVISVRNMIYRQGRDHAHRMLGASRRTSKVGESLIDYNALAYAKAMWTEQAETWRKMWPQLKDHDGTRACVALSAQTFLEAAVKEIVDVVCVDRQRDLILVGGSFLNVKLSRQLRMGWVRGNVFVHPLCGDQGAAMGHARHLWSSDLFWGERTIGDIRGSLPVGCAYAREDEWVEIALSYLEEDRPVNVVRGAAEYGPRALGNTTTFASPTRESVKLINALNDRDEAMPMAPVMTRNAALRYLEHDEITRSAISNQHMVTTIEFTERPPDDMMGVAHQDPTDDTWTARPQIVDAGPLADLLSYTKHGTLINTSFNYHGVPIVQTEDDAVMNHMMQWKKSKELGLPAPITLLVTP